MHTRTPGPLPVLSSLLKKVSGTLWAGQIPGFSHTWKVPDTFFNRLLDAGATSPLPCLIDVPRISREPTPDIGRAPRVDVLIAVSRQHRGVPAVLDDNYLGEPGADFPLVDAVDVKGEVLG